MSNRYGLSMRAADAQDADGLADLLQTAGLSVDRRGLARRLDMISAQRGAVLLATEWGPPSGVVVVDWVWTIEAQAPVAFVNNLVIDPEQRRRGIGRLLLKAASQAARTAGCGALKLTAPVGAAGLREFALATGFTVVGETLMRPLRKQA